MLKKLYLRGNDMQKWTSLMELLEMLSGLFFKLISFFIIRILAVIFIIVFIVCLCLYIVKKENQKICKNNRETEKNIE